MSAVIDPGQPLGTPQGTGPLGNIPQPGQPIGTNWATAAGVPNGSSGNGVVDTASNLAGQVQDGTGTR